MFDDDVCDVCFDCELMLFDCCCVDDVCVDDVECVCVW